MSWKRICGILFSIGVVAGCGNDDGIDVEIIPPRDLAEVEAENDADLREYLQTGQGHLSAKADDLAPGRKSGRETGG